MFYTSLSHSQVFFSKLVSIDDWNGQLDEAIPEKFPVALDEGVLSVEKEVDSRMQLNNYNGLSFLAI